MSPRVLLAALLASLAACDSAPRDNPLDPLSPAFRDEATVRGSVTGIYPPFDGRPGVRVRLVPLDAGGAERVTRTDAAGAFEARGLPSGRYEVWAEGDGFRPASATVEARVGQPVETSLRLDALPVVTAQAARTVQISRWFPDVPIFRLEVEAEATDPDRASDLAGAELVAEALGFRAPLAETAPGRYAATFDAADLPGGRVQSLLGQPLRIEATDLAGNVGTGPPLALVRVIEQTPLTARPSGLEFVAENPPVLEWRPASLPFAFTYRVEVSLVDPAGLPNLVHRTDGLPETATTLRLPAPLGAGDYVWTVWVVDAAGNRSRSKEAGFRVP